MTKGTNILTHLFWHDFKFGEDADEFKQVLCEQFIGVI
jgi:hypothetical protein